MKLRRLIFSLVAATLAVCSIGIARAEEAATEEELVEYLFVQYAKSVTLADGKLTLKGIQPETLYFSDRPHRIVGREATKKFVEYWWGEGEDSFTVNPPNAVLAVMAEPVPLDLVVVLKDPVLEGDSLVYTVEVLEGPDAGEGLANALFIDVIGRPVVGARGEVRRASRRTARRTARRVNRREERREEVVEEVIEEKY